MPYTRGAEVHRPPDAIIRECRRLADQGVVEVTLLGQTVNHYVYTHGAAISVNGREAAQVGPGTSAFTGSGRPVAVGHRRTTFADLLGRIHDEVPAIRRLRFVTSYARDFGDDILQIMKDCRRICRYLHLPAQSGSDRILRLMNRGYTSGQYLDLIDRARGPGGQSLPVAIFTVMANSPEGLVASLCLLYLAVVVSLLAGAASLLRWKAWRAS